MAVAINSKLSWRQWGGFHVPDSTKISLDTHLPHSHFRSYRKPFSILIIKFCNWTRIFKIPWTEHRTTECALSQLGIKMKLSSVSANNIWNTFDIHPEEYRPFRVDGHRLRGLASTRCADQLKNLMGQTLLESKHFAPDRKAWRQLLQ